MQALQAVATPDFVPLFDFVSPAPGRRRGPLVSIYLPISSDEVPLSVHARLLVKLKEARKLLEKAMSSEAAEDFIRPIRDRIPLMTPQARCHGLAIFSAGRAVRVCTLNVAPPELVVVAPSFHVKPLLHSRSIDDHCYVIHIRRRQIVVHSWTASGFSIERRYRLDGELTNEEGELALESRSGRFEFLQRAAKRILREFDLENSAFVVIGPRARRRRFLALVPQAAHNMILSSPASTSVELYYEKIQVALLGRHLEHCNETIKEYIPLLEVRVASNSLEELAAAAAEGQIDTLFVDPNVQVWGVFNPVLGAVETHPFQQGAHDDCVIDDIVEEVIKNHGVIRFFDSTAIPGGIPYLGVLRGKEL